MRSRSAARSDSGTAWVSVTHTDGSTLWVAGDVNDKIHKGTYR